MWQSVLGTLPQHAVWGHRQAAGKVTCLRTEIVLQWLQYGSPFHGSGYNAGLLINSVHVLH